ncbi:MAG: VIT domain-containing protein [Thermodesulfobacteriota bacterium]|nr:VIT domain-containing protein [Thermodesulfobacteriota bacterium]
MKFKTRAFGSLIFVVCMLFGSVVYAQPERSNDKTGSPYFFVKSDAPETDRLPLKSTSVKVDISGVIADVVVTQVYTNEGTRPLEAIYIFPASTRAAVYGMTMTIGERTITAKIREREEARRQYDQAKQAGQSASLLEQHRPNVFQMNVANILPADVIRVELRYTELLVPTDSVYEFVYPTVVGPRYTDHKNSEEGSSETWIGNPYLRQGEPPTYTFGMEVNLSTGLPIKDLVCTSHHTDINYHGKSTAAVTLKPSEKYGGNRDFILKYRLAGGKIESGLLLFEGQDENFFLLMMQPPKRVRNVHIPAREYIFIVDVSGSMHGFPLDISKKLLKDLISNLRPTDRFNVLLFAGGSSVMSNVSLPATGNNISKAINTIERQRGGGGTRLLPALQRALALPKAEGFSRTIVIVTDGYVSVEEEAFDLIRNNLGNANMFPFGIGSSVNRYIIEGMARVGMGEPFVITKPGEASKKAEKFRSLIQSPVLTGIKIDFNEFNAYDVEPPSIPDVLADRPVIVFGKYRGKLKGTIHLRGISGDQPYTEKIDMGNVKPSKTNSALRYLWARHRIALLADYNRLNQQDERVQEVTQLGLTYNLLTAYTSFVAIDTQIRLKNGQAVTVKQPLPLPQGVSNYAVGNRGYVKRGMSLSAPLCGALPTESRVKEESVEPEKKDHSASGQTIGKTISDKDHIQLGKIMVSDGLLKNSIRKVIESTIPSINRCYSQKPGVQSEFKGEIVITLVIDPKGRVLKVSAEKSPNKTKIAKKCILQTFKKLRFPASRDTGNGVVTVTFILM